MDKIGYFDEYGQPKLSLQVKGLRKTLRIDPVVDTGFNGDIALPISSAVPLGLELRGQVPIELADGSTKTELVFQGWVVWQKREHEVKIFLTNSSDALLGSGLMQGHKLNIDYSNLDVALSPSPKKKSNRKDR